MSFWERVANLHAFEAVVLWSVQSVLFVIMQKRYSFEEIYFFVVIPKLFESSLYISGMVPFPCKQILKKEHCFIFLSYLSFWFFDIPMSKNIMIQCSMEKPALDLPFYFNSKSDAAHFL